MGFRRSISSGRRRPLPNHCLGTDYGGPGYTQHLRLALPSAKKHCHRRASHAVSKAALPGMTKSLARALAPGIRVNCVAPGAVETRWWSGNEARMR
ncbi:SDR family oxidoreductase [Burkholderia diffusa]|uniref:SDR family oxidoreductase n=1 Tax=Burkholderia diffusa TaxID=488732 RepID=UPI001247E1B4|nr:SDR family oxidoreductase [Burkholderia diffusa]KAB0650701.1 SDR family oxidoreductase [Burkholderia diffusa]MBM2656300.1 SDR family oxidoreductase [Burkholderia diffusa]